jgi:hypothetical protein
MENDKKSSTAKSRIPSVAETTAGIEKEQVEQDAKMQETPPKSDESVAFETSMQTTSRTN